MTIRRLNTAELRGLDKTRGNIYAADVRRSTPWGGRTIADVDVEWDGYDLYLSASGTALEGPEDLREYATILREAADAMERHEASQGDSQVPPRS